MKVTGASNCHQAGQTPPPYPLLQLLSEESGEQYLMHTSWVVLQMLKPPPDGKC